jgi:iron complex outermembrane receptor protein
MGMLKRSLILIASISFFPVVVLATDLQKEDQPVFALEEVVVTASRNLEGVEKIPAQVTVITAEDIAKSTARDVIGLLSVEGGLVTRGFLGNDKKSAIDIRGMGETSVSNVLVLVDGIRINPSDMAGPDFSAIVLDQIERVEIVHGAGTVQYGNGAVGGVINIITRKPGGEKQVDLKLETGSYNFYQGTASARGSYGRFHLTVLGNYTDSDGYRESNNFENQNFDVKAAVDVNDWLYVSGKVQLHRDEYFYPGPLTYAQFKEDPRQSLDITGSSGDTRDDMYAGGLEAHLGGLGEFFTTATFRERKNEWTLSGSPGEIQERSRELSLKHKLEHAFAWFRNELSTGFDYRLTDYFQVTSFAAKPYEIDSSGLYFLDKATIADHWIVQCGVRRHVYDTTLKVTGDTDSFDSTDYTLGLIRRFGGKDRFSGSLFGNFATSFRMPDVDEYGFATDDIRPQTGTHWDLGLKIMYRKRAELSLTGFFIRIEDEIWFDALNYINTNYDNTTRRQGVDVSIRVYPTDRLRVWGNYTNTDATFENSDFKVPTVPNHKASAGFNWSLCSWLDWAATYNYVGERPQGGDPIANSTYGEMPHYQTVDTRFTVGIKRYNLSVFAAVNNILGKDYYSLAYYDSVYPSPGRNFRVGASWAY